MRRSQETGGNLQMAPCRDFIDFDGVDELFVSLDAESTVLERRAAKYI
jgi:hypothetical protein